MHYIDYKLLEETFAKILDYMYLKFFYRTEQLNYTSSPIIM